MTQQQKEAYEDTDELRREIRKLKGRKFRLDCGHYVTFGCNLGNDITVYNGKVPEIRCAQCGY